MTCFPYGSHHSHFQPRHPDGRWISYATSGRRVGIEAVTNDARAVVDIRRPHWAAAAPAVWTMPSTQMLLAGAAVPGFPTVSIISPVPIWPAYRRRWRRQLLRWSHGR